MCSGRIVVPAGGSTIRLLGEELHRTVRIGDPSAGQVGRADELPLEGGCELEAVLDLQEGVSDHQKRECGAAQGKLPLPKYQ